MKKIAFLLSLCFFSCRPFGETMQNAELSHLPEHNPSAYEITQQDFTLPAAACDLVYFSQNDSRWADKNYGPQNRIATYGCGPTVLAMLVSSLTEQSIQPDEMAAWCYENGFFSQNSGSYHSIIPDGARAWGLDAKSLSDRSYHGITQELYSGRLVVLLMGKGHFTDSGHFIILRNVTLEGNFLIADPNSRENSLLPWDPEVILSEIKGSYDAGGPAWSIGAIRKP